MTATFPNLGRMTYPQFGPNGGLVAAWSPCLVSETASTLMDLTDNRRHGTMLGGASFVTSGGAQAVTFDGTDDYVSMPLQNVGFAEGTICWWMRPTRGYNDGLIHGMWGHITALNTIPEFDCQKFSNNSWYCGFNATADDDRVVVAASASNYTQNEWQHYVFRWQSGGDSELWRNGVQFGTKTGTTTPRNIANNWEIGRQNQTLQWFQGQTDDFLIYNRRLNATEIDALYRLGRGGWAKQIRRRATGFTAAAPPTFTGKTFKAMRLAR